jgi:hypothetical protein
VLGGVEVSYEKYVYLELRYQGEVLNLPSVRRATADKHSYFPEYSFHRAAIRSFIRFWVGYMFTRVPDNRALEPLSMAEPRRKSHVG